MDECLEKSFYGRTNELAILQHIISMEYKNLRFPIIIVSIYSVNGSELYKESSSRPKCQY